MVSWALASRVAVRNNPELPEVPCSLDTTPRRSVDLRERLARSRDWFCLMSSPPVSRSLLLDALAATEHFAPPSFPGVHDLLRACGFTDADLDSFTPSDLWSAFNTEYGGVAWQTMRAMNVIDHGATPEWFRAQKLSRERADEMLRQMRARAAMADACSRRPDVADSAPTKRFRY